MSNEKTKLLLIFSVILASLLSNILSNPFIELENKGGINHDTTLAYALPDPSQNNTEIQSTASPINQTNNASSEVSALVNKGDVLYDQGNNTQAIQYYDKALALDSQNSDAFSGKQDAISKIAESAPTSGFNRGCVDAQIPNPSERYINRFNTGPSSNSDAFMQVYNEGFTSCSSNIPRLGETLKMFNIIVLKGNVTNETANTRICTTVSEGGPQTICQNLDNLNPENNSSVIESHIFTFENVPVNASFHSCIQRLIYPNVTLCDNYGSTNDQGPTVEQIRLPFLGVDPAAAEDDEGYGICPQYLTEVQCYGKIVKTPDDGYDINDTSIDQASKQIAIGRAAVACRFINSQSDSRLKQAYSNQSDSCTKTGIPSFASAGGGDAFASAG
jgi:tetratricopeptide (TPR) repeat protein